MLTSDIIHKLSTIKSSKTDQLSILLIYCGGTLGMVLDPQSKSLVPNDFNNLLTFLPEVSRIETGLDIVSIKNPIDSSNVSPKDWIEIAEIIEVHYENYQGFVIIHGTDTMSYTASALSFMLEGLQKPVIFTGAQLPIGAARTDAKENLMTALEIASSQNLDGSPVIKEVCIYFSSYLLRANRSKKKESDLFYAFRSENYPALAEVGVQINFNLPYLKSIITTQKLFVNKQFDTNLLVLKLFPGINEIFLNTIFSLPNLKAIILETFGAGNAPTHEWFLEILKKAIHQGILILNITQCDGGKVIQGHYKTSTYLEKIGVVNGNDMTIEAAIPKLMIGLCKYTKTQDLKTYLESSQVGELTSE